MQIDAGRDTWLELPNKVTRENRWALWRLAKKLTPKGRPIIDLLQAGQPESPASPDDPYTWSSFAQAHQSFRRSNGQFQGLAYMNSSFAPILTITFYNALSEGKIAPWAMRYFDILNSYAEEGVVPGSLILVYEGGSQKPLSWGNISIRFNPFIAFTGAHLPGSPERVGTSPNRLEAFMSESRRDFERLIKRRGNNPKAHMMGKNLERLLSGLQGVRKIGPSSWVAFSPVGIPVEPNLTVRLDGDRILLFDHSGVPTEEVIKALGIGYEHLQVDSTPPELHLELLAPLVRPLEGVMLQQVRQFQEKLRQAQALPEAFKNLGFSYQEALEAGLGMRNPQVGVVVYNDLEGHPLSAQMYQGDGTAYTLTPGFPGGVWLGPGLAQARNGLLVVEGVFNAILVWSLVRQEGLGVVGLADVHQNLPQDLIKRLNMQSVYLYSHPGPDREHVLNRWAHPLKAEGFPVVFLGDLVPGKRVDFAQFAQERGQQGLLERLVELGVGN